MKSKLRILIIRPDRIGDVVLSTPMPREIKKKYPDSFIALLLRSYTKELYLNNPYVDEIIIFDEDPANDLSSMKKNWKLIRSYKFTHSFMLLPKEKINWLLFFAGIRNRFGVGHKFYQFITNAKSTYRRKYIPLRHEADYCMDMARKIGVEPESISTEIFLTEAEKQKRDEIKNRICPNGEKLIGINTTSGMSAPNMPVSEYRKLTEKLNEVPGIKVVVTDLLPPKEMEGLEDVEYPNIGNNLRESIINFAALDLLISASTGPMHIAAALKVETLSLFCPLPACSPKLWGPMGNQAEIILPGENYCSIKCPGDPKKCRFEGEVGIDHETVFNRTMLLIEKQNTGEI